MPGVPGATAHSSPPQQFYQHVYSRGWEGISLMLHHKCHPQNRGFCVCFCRIMLQCQISFNMKEHCWLYAWLSSSGASEFLSQWKGYWHYDNSWLKLWAAARNWHICFTPSTWVNTALRFPRNKGKKKTTSIILCLHAHLHTSSFTYCLPDITAFCRGLNCIGGNWNSLRQIKCLSRKERKHLFERPHPMPTEVMSNEIGLNGINSGAYRVVQISFR